MINIFIELAPSGLLQGLILSIVVTGIMVPFKLLDFADITSEGSYPLGGALCASLIVAGYNPLVSLLIACLAAGVAGICSAFIHIKYKINTLLAGIIISTMIYTINLRTMGKPNIALFEQANLFSDLSDGITTQILTLLTINIILMAAIYRFLTTEKGLQLRAVGLNSGFAKKQGININNNIIFGLFAGNALAGLAGAMLVQIQGYADIGMGIGIVIHALAAMMMGEKLIGSDSLLKIVISPLIGALIYQQIQGMALAAGFAPSDLKFLTGAILLGIIALK